MKTNDHPCQICVTQRDILRLQREIWLLALHMSSSHATGCAAPRCSRPSDAHAGDVIRSGCLHGLEHLPWSSSSRRELASPNTNMFTYFKVNVSVFAEKWCILEETHLLKVKNSKKYKIVFFEGSSSSDSILRFVIFDAFETAYQNIQKENYSLFSPKRFPKIRWSSNTSFDLFVWNFTIGYQTSWT